MAPSLGILAAASTSDAPVQAIFEWGRVQSPLDWILPTAVFLALCWFVVGMYLVDCRELGGRLATLLSSLRILALLGLLAIWLQPQWRARRDVVDPSRVLVLVDTSQSMEHRDGDESAGTATAASTAGTPVKVASPPSTPTDAGGKSRIEQVVDALASGSIVGGLRQRHDVVIYRFDEDDAPTAVATLPRLAPAIPPIDASQNNTAIDAAVSQTRLRLAVAGLVGLGGLVGVGVYLAYPLRKGRPPHWLLAFGGLTFAVGAGGIIWALAAKERPSIAALIGIDRGLAVPHIPKVADAKKSAAGTDTQDALPDWREVLTARGTETRLGQAIYRLVQDERSAPISAILLLSDGQQNAGLEWQAAAEAAREARIPVFPIGLGTRQKRTQVRLADFEAPVRAFPGDYFVVTAYLSANGLSGRTATVRLRQVPLEETAGQPAAPLSGIDEERDILFAADQEDVAVKFEVQGIKTAGRYGFELSVEGAAAGSDARQRFQIEIVDRRTKVLLISGGPGREYRFLRNLLRRDKRIALDVWLQSSVVEKSKDDYPKQLTAFPDSKDKLFDYDCIIALDPDWRRLDENQASLLENWVAEQAGGLIVVPGRVFAGSAVKSWINDTRLARVRALYPVDFPNIFFQAEDVGRKWSQVLPLSLTREGADAEFLRLDDNPSENQRIWESRFGGVFGAHVVRGAKPGAVVYARFGDATAAGGEAVYFAGQFYGSGRVFYFGSAELWRLRELSEAYFEQFYTKLVRNVSQGRLLRGSRRGDVLLVEKSRYHVGDNVPVVAHLKNSRREPLEVQHVSLFSFAPGNNKAAPLELSRDATRKGMYRGQFVVRREGDYRLELPLAESSEEPLSKVIKVTASALENENPQRNDALLASLASTTGGRYFVGLDAALGRQSDPPVASLLKDQTQTTPVLGDRDPRWDSFWSRLMMFGVCGVLALEWLVRRLSRLA